MRGAFESVSALVQVTLTVLFFYGYINCFTLYVSTYFKTSTKVKGKLVWTLFNASKRAQLRGFHQGLGQTTEYIMLLWKDQKSSAQRACYLPNLSRYPFIHMGREKSKCAGQGITTGCILPIGYSVLFKLRYLKNLKLFSIRVKELC